MGKANKNNIKKHLIGREEEIKNLYLQNYLNYKQIANIISIKQITLDEISYFLQHNCKVPKMGRHEKEVLNKNKEIRELAKKKYSINRISNTLGLNRYYLSKYIQEQNIKIKKHSKALRPRVEKIYNKNKQMIYRYAEQGYLFTEISRKLKIDLNDLFKITYYDLELNELLKQNKRDRISNSDTLKKQRQRYYKFEDLPEEVWVQLKSHPTYYVSNMGRMKHYLISIDTYRLLKLNAGKQGYVHTQFGKMHRLVAKIFLPKPSKDKIEVNHKNGIKTDNRYTNLEWVSPKENMQHAFYNIPKYSSRIGKFRKIIIDDKYEFSTISAAYKFLSKEKLPNKYEFSKIFLNSDEAEINSRKLKLIR